MGVNDRVQLGLERVDPQIKVEVKKDGKIFINGTEYKIHNLTIGSKEIIGKKGSKALTEHQREAIKALVAEAFAKIQHKESSFDQLHIGSSSSTGRSFVSIDYKSGEKTQFDRDIVKTESLFHALKGGKSQSHFDDAGLKILQEMLKGTGATLDYDAAKAKLDDVEGGVITIKDAFNFVKLPVSITDQDEVLAHIRNVRGDRIKNWNLDSEVVKTQFWTEFEEIRDKDKPRVERPRVQEQGPVQPQVQPQIQKDRTSNQFDKVDLNNLEVKLRDSGATFNKGAVLEQMGDSSTIAMQNVFDAIQLPNVLQNEADILAKIRLVKGQTGEQELKVSQKEFWTEFDKGAIKINSEVKTFRQGDINKLANMLQNVNGLRADFTGLNDNCSHSDVLAKITITQPFPEDAHSIAKYIKSEKEDEEPNTTQSTEDLFEKLEWCNKTADERTELMRIRRSTEETLTTLKAAEWKKISDLFNPESVIGRMIPDAEQVVETRDQLFELLKGWIENQTGESQDIQNVLASFKDETAKRQLKPALLTGFDEARVHLDLFSRQTHNLQEIP